MNANDDDLDDDSLEEDAYWAAEADAVLDRLARGEEGVITLEEWEARRTSQPAAS